ncbi:MAG TPA: N4-gp56 family major capsid protein, partial [Hyphomonas sp.]|nr:N4-gp56 family major capsid protein [Hyphomonas sp.]
MKVTKIENSTPNYGSEQIDAAFIAVCHTDVEADIREMVGFVPVEKYGTAKALPYEIGKVEDVRYVASALLNPFIGAGSTTIANVENNGTNVNVYPVIYFGKEAFADVPLKGRGAIEPSIVPVGQKDKSDPLGQRGFVGWKAYYASVILNHSWLIRCEVAVSSLG